MDRIRLVAALSVALLPVPFEAVQAQARDAEASPPSLESFGFWLAGESLPRAVDPICGNAAGRRGGAVFGGFLVIPVGPIGLEARASRHRRGTNFNCAFHGSSREGTLTVNSADVAAGNFTTFDLRFRLAAGSRNQWVFALGAGWAASRKDIPYLTSSVGLRGGTTVRLGADLALNSYRVPWTARTAEYERGSIVNLISDRPFKEWATSFGLRFTLEVPVSHRR